MVILSSCSSTKRSRVNPALTVAAVRARRLEPFAREWVKRVDAAAPAGRAGDIYGGPGVKAALAAARRLECPAYFVSAGLSLLPEGQQVPAYDLSVAAGESCPPALASGEATAAQWWAALNNELGRDRPIASLVRRTDGQVLMALPGSYLSMVVDDLFSLSQFQRAKLRLIVSESASVPAWLEPSAIRYDQRLSGIATAPKGANAYFAQRALGHFVDLIVRHKLEAADIAVQRAKVMQELGRAAVVPTPKRQPQSEAQVLRWIESTDPKRARSATALLGEFRRAGFACEQARFRGVYEQRGKAL
jgi:hypothetical protein